MATSRLDEIAVANGATFLLLRKAADEAGALREVVNGESIRVPIDFGPYLRTGRLRIIDLETTEFVRYVEYAGEVDDGEAATIAAAVCRNLPLATDDRKARRLCAGLGLQAPVRTLALLRRYTERVTVSSAEVRDLLGAVRDRASFVAPRADPDAAWWHANLDKGT